MGGREGWGGEEASLWGCLPWARPGAPAVSKGEELQPRQSQPREQGHLETVLSHHPGRTDRWQTPLGSYEGFRGWTFPEPCGCGIAFRGQCPTRGLVRGQGGDTPREGVGVEGLLTKGGSLAGAPTGVRTGGQTLASAWGYPEGTTEGAGPGRLRQEGTKARPGKSRGELGK